MNTHFEFVTQPFEHQLQVFNKIKDLSYYALFHEMGTGKTKLLIDLIRYKRLFPVLIVAPNSVIYNWKKEIGIHAKPALFDSAVVLQGSKSERIAKLNNSNNNVFIINYEGLRVIADELLKVKWGMMICDEMHRCKSPKAIQTKLVIEISKNAATRYVATGTPILNSLLDIFTTYLFLDRGETFGTNFFGFRNRYFKDMNAHFKSKNWYFPKYVLYPSVEKDINEKMYRIADRKLKEDCLDLPDKVYSVIEVDMLPEQKTRYEDIKEDLITFFKDKAAIAQTALTKILRLNQVTSGFLTADDGSIIDFGSAKMDALKDLINDILPSKVIIWAHFRHDIEKIAEVTKAHNPVVVYGGVKNKQELMDKFQTDPECKIFIGQQHSAGIGVTLTAANYAIYYSNNYSLEDRLQSEDRCHRSGSEVHDKITYYDLVCRDTVDSIIINAIRAKEDLASLVLDKIKGGE